jgi:hypothetical protein
MRACEGCRRRKIKCDAATTNTWPCSACIRLKLHCVPPTVTYDANGQGFDSEGVQYEDAGADEEYHNQVVMQHQLAGSQKGPQQVYAQQVPYGEGVGTYQQVPYGQSLPGPQNLHFQNMQGPGGGIIDGHYPTQNVVQGYPVTPIQQQPQHSASPDSYNQDQYDQRALSDLLGDLRMSEAGTGAYILQSRISELTCQSPISQQQAEELVFRRASV